MMISIPQPTRITALVIALLCSCAAAQSPPVKGDSEQRAGQWGDLALTKDSEAGFMRFIHMAQTGRLGDDVTNANVGVFKNTVRVELVRGAAPKKVLLLTPRSSAQETSHYFDVEPGEGVTAIDVTRVAKALDEAFADDPFDLTGVEELPGSAPIPSLAAGWSGSGYRGVLRVLERRTMTVASLQYTIAVIVTLAIGLLASLVVLLGSDPMG